MTSAILAGHHAHLGIDWAGCCTWDELGRDRSRERGEQSRDREGYVQDAPGTFPVVSVGGHCTLSLLRAQQPLIATFVLTTFQRYRVFRLSRTLSGLCGPKNFIY